MKGDAKDAGAGDPLGIPGLEIRRRIGGGGFADVYEARARRLDRIVAVKILRSRTRPSPEVVERFEAECRWVARLEHRNVVTVHWADMTPEGRLYLVMEMMRGSLRDDSEPTGLDWRSTVDACVQTARALEAAHEIGLVHRDVKPANILRGPGQLWKLADFGIARSVEELADHDGVTFTPGYRAPEGQQSAKSDVYSLGATIFAALRSTTPDPPRSPTQPSASIAALDGIPAPLRALIGEMLAFAPEDRPPMAVVRELLEQLGATHDTTDPGAGPPPPPPPPEPPSPEPPSPGPPKPAVPDPEGPEPPPDGPGPEGLPDDRPARSKGTVEFSPGTAAAVSAAIVVVLLVLIVVLVVTSDGGERDGGGARDEDASETTWPSYDAPEVITVAGRGPTDESEERVATRRQLVTPSDVAIDGDDIYVADTGHHQILKVGDGSAVTTVAGANWTEHEPNQYQEPSDESLTALGVALRSPDGIDVYDGNLYVADTGNDRVLMIELRTGRTHVIAGTGEAGFAGDDRDAVEAQLDAPRDVGVDAAGRVFIADTGNGRVRMVEDGTITTLIGGGDGPVASEEDPRSWSVDPQRVAVYRDLGTVAISTATQLAIVDLDRHVHLIAGGGAEEGDDVVGRPGSEVTLSPSNVSIDDDGGLLFTDSLRNRVLRSGRVGDIEAVTDLVNEAGEEVAPDALWGAARDRTGRLVVALRTYATFHYVQRFGADGRRDLAVGYDAEAPDEEATLEDGESAPSGYIDGPTAVAVDGSGQLYIAVTWPQDRRRILRVVEQTAYLVADLTTEGWPVTDAGAPGVPGSMAFDGDDTLYISFPQQHQVVAVVDGELDRVLGTGEPGRGEPGGPGSATAVDYPSGVAWHDERGLIVADENNNRVLAVDPDTGVELIAGTGDEGYEGDGGPAVAAWLDHPSAVAVRETDIYVLDNGNRRIRVIDDRELIYKLAGDPDGTALLPGDSVDALEGDVLYGAGSSLAVAEDGTVHLLRIGYWHAIISIRDGIASFTVGRRPGVGFGPRLDTVELFEPESLALYPSGRVVVADYGNDRVLSLEI